MNGIAMKIYQVDILLEYLQCMFLPIMTFMLSSMNGIAMKIHPVNVLLGYLQCMFYYSTMFNYVLIVLL